MPAPQQATAKLRSPIAFRKTEPAAESISVYRSVWIRIYEMSPTSIPAGTEMPLHRFQVPEKMLSYFPLHTVSFRYLDNGAASIMQESTKTQPTRSTYDSNIDHCQIPVSSGSKPEITACITLKDLLTLSVSQYIDRPSGCSARS